MIKSRYSITPNSKGGFNVSEGFWNPMPGATNGFTSIAMARLAIRILDRCKGDSDRFWRLWYRASGVTDRRRKLANRLAREMGFTIRRIDSHTSIMEIQK